MPQTKPSRSEINRTHPLARGLVAAWPLADRGGTRIRDIAGKRSDGVGTNVTATNWTTREYGPGMWFPGETQAGAVVDCGLPAPLQITRGSVYALIRPTAYTRTAARIAATQRTGGSDPYINYGLYLPSTTGEIAFFVSTGIAGSFAEAKSAAQAAGRWYSVVGTYDQSNIRIYINGALAATTAKSGALNTADAKFYIGNHNAGGGGSEGFHGHIADVRVWSRELAAHEIRTLYSDPWALYSPERRRIVKAPATATTFRRTTFARAGSRGVLGGL